MSELVGQYLGRYHIVEQIGQGGMATVYKAFDTRLERDVAVKLIRKTAFSPEILDNVLQRFEREAKALAKFSHPNILKIHDFGEFEGSPYLILEYLPGGTLKDRLNKPIPWQDAIRLLLPVARGLSYAHRHGVLHRDVKPSNILITELGEPMLTDFGIAKLLEGAEGHTLTGSGVGIGTPEYMAPEQGIGQGVDARADIYSLGIVLYEMVTGQKPYTADTPMAVVLKQMTDPLPRPRQFQPSLPIEVENLLFKALAKKPEDRYPDMDTFISALENLSGGQTSPAPIPVPSPKTIQAEYTQKAINGVIEPSTPLQPVPAHLTAPLSDRPIAQPARKRLWLVGLAFFGLAGICIAGFIVMRSLGFSFDFPASLFGAAQPTSTNRPPTPAPTATIKVEKVKIRWFVGLGTGTDPAQVAAQEEVVRDFNSSQNRIELVLEIVPYDSARDTLSVQIAAGDGPDLIGPVGWGGSNDFHGQWLDLAPYIRETDFDISIFDPALVRFYQTEEGQVGLPFAVFPGAMYFVPAMFDEAGLAYPPQKYGEKYVLDGQEVDWNWNTVSEVARRLTVDKNGNNAKSPNFARNAIVQVGYSPQWQSILSIATFYDGATKLYSGEKRGEYRSTLPAGWKEAWKWYYDGMWGKRRFIASGPLAGSPEFGAGNIFNSGKAAMALTQTWYTCCLGDFAKAGNEFQLGILPMGADGRVHGRIDADTFRIWKGTRHPKEAFQVLAYLITTGGDKLLPVYGAMPAIPSKTQAFFAKKSADYPFVTQESWNVFIQGLSYPDIPSSEQYQPNSIEATARFATFFDLLNNTEGLNFDFEYQKLVDDLNVIYNK